MSPLFARLASLAETHLSRHDQDRSRDLLVEGGVVEAHGAEAAPDPSHLAAADRSPIVGDRSYCGHQVR